MESRAIMGPCQTTPNYEKNLKAGQFGQSSMVQLPLNWAMKKKTWLLSGCLV